MDDCQKLRLQIALVILMAKKIAWKNCKSKYTQEDAEAEEEEEEEEESLCLQILS